MTQNNLTEHEMVAEIKRLRGQHLNREEIASILHTTLSDIKRLIKKHGITKPQKETSSPIVAPKTIPLPANDGIPLMEQAKTVLGDRLKVTWEGYWLDGKPVNSDAVIKEAGLKYADDY